MAFQKGLGCVHSLSHSLGGVDPRLHHGTLNAVFLPAVIRFNAGAESVQKDQRLQRMAQAMGLAIRQRRRPIAIRDMNARLGLPSGLAAMGVTPDLRQRDRRRAGRPLPQDQSAARERATTTARCSKGRCSPSAREARCERLPSPGSRRAT
jgi:alcohol dehydrogenase class IV